MYKLFAIEVMHFIFLVSILNPYTGGLAVSKGQPVSPGSLEEIDISMSQELNPVLDSYRYQSLRSPQKEKVVHYPPPSHQRKDPELKPGI